MPITNEAWTQASLPVKDGGLGIRKIEDLSIAAYFSSMHSSKPLVDSIVPALPTEYIRLENDAAELWAAKSGAADVPEQPEKQKSWETVSNPMCCLDLGYV